MPDGRSRPPGHRFDREPEEPHVREMFHNQNPWAVALAVVILLVIFYYLFTVG